MKLNHLALLLLVSLSLLACQEAPEAPTAFSISSPSATTKIDLALQEDGSLGYAVFFKDQLVIDTSTFSFDFKSAPNLGKGLEVLSTETKEIRENWEMPWGEQREVVNNGNELQLNLREVVAPNRSLSITFRAYDDGVAYRYHFPEQEGKSELVIMDENTEFMLTGDHKVWWIPGDWDIYEHVYNETQFSAIDATSKRDNPNLAQTTIPENAVNTPVTLKTADGIYLSFHEANLTDYSGMTLKVDKDRMGFVSELVGSPDDSKVTRSLPFSTPWRTIQIADRAGDLIESNLIVNLNEPNKLEDVSWLKPMKYMGIWWEMHLGTSTWKLEGGKHGATTENAKRYIDFAAANGIEGLLVEGWNTGWERWIGFEDREGVFDFVTPYEDYDIEEVVRYGREKGVELVMHHETSAAPRTYEQQLDTAYALMKKLGIHSVKTGYVGKIIPAGQYHHGQWMVNHYRKVLEQAVKYEVAIDAHEPIKATGLRRTYPNMMTREGLRGQEFNAWSAEGGNPVDHLTVVAFTRMLAGPIDYTPGVFNLKIDPFKPDNRVRHTLAHELALYVVIYSPLQMVSDLPEHLEGQPGMQFVRDVAVDWEQSKVLDGEIGDFVVIARQERGGENWFVGGIGDENPRTLSVNFDFLPKGKTYTATIYKDGPNAHWESNPNELTIAQENVTADSKLAFDLVSGGGFAISLKVK
ncbi:MAG: glycoside hydrolase family 97 protein [Bacteroidota bacterium]